MRWLKPERTYTDGKWYRRICDQLTTSVAVDLMLPLGLTTGLTYQGTFGMSDHARNHQFVIRLSLRFRATGNSTSASAFGRMGNQPRVLSGVWSCLYLTCRR